MWLMESGSRLLTARGLGCADSVLDLATVEVVPSEDVVVFLGERHEIHLLQNADALYEDLEDGLLGPLIKAIISQSDMDPGLESVVKRLICPPC